MTASNNDNDRTQTHIILTKGTMVSHYRIVEKIGAGGMGEVFLAEDTKLNRKVALKFLPPHLCQDDDCRKRFTREAQAAAGLDHPNIAGIFEVGEFKGRPFFSMQIVEGQSLRDVIAGKDLAVGRILEIAIQVCEGLQAAHSKEIIHRDIKPSNILIDSYGRVRIVDFGLAAVGGSEHLTKTGSTLGTIGYMSPEQVRGQEVDHRSDLFSLGVVLYELITKQNPFKRDSEAATLAAVSQDNPEPLTRYKADIPDGLQRTVTKLLEKDSSLRYQTAAGLVSDLKTLTRDQSPVAEKPPVDWWNRYVVVGAVVVCLIVAVYWLFSRTEEKTPQVLPERIMLAVLPFENLGSAEDEYFADGMTEEITARLASVKDLGVIARTSIKQYKNTDKSIAQIGEELGVDYILEGTVRWQKAGTSEARIRVTPQLIRVSDATHVWANVYDEVLSEVFQLQTNIAGQVVDGLNITLVETEQEALAAVPTMSLEAYDYYLQGKEYYDHYTSGDDLELAAQMFEKALELDSTFAAAHTWLTRIISIVANFADPVLADSLRQIAFEHAVKAQEFSTNGVDGHLAMGFYYHGTHEYDQALNELEKALSQQPNNSEVIDATAGVLRRQGHWQEALVRYERNARLDPRSVATTWSLALTYFYMRRFADCAEVLERGMSLAPNWWPYKTFRAWTIMAEGQSVDSALALIDKASIGEGEQFTESFKMRFYYLKRDFAQCATLQTAVDSFWNGDSAEYYLLRGHAYDQLGQLQTARNYYDSAQTVLESRLERGSTKALDFASLGQIYALQGDTVRALEVGRKGNEMLPLSKDAIEGALVLEVLANIYSLVGESDSAIDILDTLLRVPSHLNVSNVRRDAFWDPLRDHPRFQALMEKYGKEQRN